MGKKKEFFKKAGITASKAILIALAAGALAGAVAVAPGGVQGLLQILGKVYEGKGRPDYDERQLRRALRYLKSRKLVDIQSQYQKEVFSLTKLGRWRARKLAKSFGIVKPKKWDRKWRIVIFDVPEKKKEERDIYRQQLKNLGLAHLQQSIFIHPYECRDQVYYLAGNMFIKPYVRYIIAEEVTGQDDLRRRFGQ